MRLLKKDSESQVVDLVSSLKSGLGKVLPEQQNGEIRTLVQTLFDASCKQPLQPLLEIVSYFSSNCMLSSSQMEAFVRWVIDQEFVDRLKKFLEIDLPTVRAFRSRLLEAGIKSQQIAFTKQIHGAGVKFDEFADIIMETVDNPDFVLFVLARIDPKLLKGEPGGQLLHKHISWRPNCLVIQKLLDAGAEVNIRTSNKFQTTLLWQAIKAESLETVRCLVERGADVNQVSGFEPMSLIGYACVQNEILIVEYLLQNGANTTVSVDSMPLIDYVAYRRPKIYTAIRTRLPGVSIVVPTQIVAAANSDPKVWLSFVAQHPGLPEQRLEQALVKALQTEKTKAVVNLLHHGVDPNGSHLDKSSQSPLEVAVFSPETWFLTYHYMDLLIHAKANVNIDGLIDRLFWGFGVFAPLVFEKLINAGLDLDRYGGKMLETAVSRDATSLAAIPFLLDKGVSIESYGNRFTVLQAVANGGDDEQLLLKYLINRGANVNAPPFSVRGRTALQAAAQSQNLEMLHILCDHGADINGPIALTGGFTSLEAALRPRESEDDESFDNYDEISTEAFHFLLGRGALVNRPDGSPSPLLHDLLEIGAANSFRQALEAGANPNHYWETYSFTGDRTPLQVAAEMGNFTFVKLLLDFGVSPNEPPGYQFGRTALQGAASSAEPNIELVQLLISHGATINAPLTSLGGITALQGAAIRGHINIARTLIENGAEVNAFPALNEGRTAIEGAAEHGRLDMVVMLINAGAIGDVVGKKGFSTAISLAKMNRHFQVAELLEEHRVQ